MKTNMAESLFRNIQAGAASTTPSFKKGQMVFGSITTLYPNQQAVVKIAGREMVAQLQASLDKGETYWFQVESVDPYLQLKIAAGKNTENQNMKQLLSFAGLKATKERVAVLKMMVDNRLPLHKNQLQQIMHLVDQVGLKNLNLQAVKEMVSRQLPVNQALYQAFTSRGQASLTQQLTDVLAEMKAMDNRPPVSDKLIQKITQLMLQPSLQMDNVTESIKKISFQTTTGEKIQVNSSSELHQLMKDQLPVSATAKQQLSKFSVLLSKMHESSITKEEAIQMNYLTKSLVKSGIFDKVSALTGQPLAATMDNAAKQGAEKLVNIDKSLVRNLEMMATRQLSRVSEAQLFNEAQKMDSTRPAPVDPKDYFLSKLKNHMFQFGLNYESAIMADTPKSGSGLDTNSLKSLLLQTGMDSMVSGKAEKLEMLVQTLSGIQLSSVSENSSFMQVSIQLPGDSIGIKEDIHLDLESRKNKDGEIDPSFCKILFYLKLGKLEDTVIDMSVVDRNVALTIFNEKDAEEMFESLRSSLEEGLLKLDYKLVSLKVKEMNSAHSDETETRPHQSLASFKGVDYRI